MRSYGKKIFYFTLALIACFASMIVIVRASYQSDFPFQSLNGPSATSAGPILSEIKNTSVNSNEINSVPAAPQKATGASYVGGPVLTIPSINVNAPIVPVGFTVDGNMATPDRLSDVGWYEYGTPIGDAGSAVIAGHVDNG